MTKRAIISDCSAHRYRLWRKCDKTLPICAFSLLNPSTAASEVEIRRRVRVIDFAKPFKCGGAYTFNLYDYRAAKPAELPKPRRILWNQSDALRSVVAHLRMLNQRPPKLEML
ncbi:MAG: DUF1643 domain-containing protein [Pseudomonadota bacterium]